MHSADSIPQPSAPSRDIAIIGMSGRFPGAGSVEALWENLTHGVESISHLSPDQLLGAGVSPTEWSAPDYVPAAAVLEGAESFDAEFFGMSLREAQLTDPQHRVFLECAWEAMESAGYAPGGDGAAREVGVFAGAASNSYLRKQVIPASAYAEVQDSLQVEVSNDKDYLALRASYHLGLRGPSFTVQTACSSSLTAIHLACQSLRTGECALALAGGSAVRTPQLQGYRYKPGGVRSRDGHTRPFDAEGSGTVFGSGAGVVVLKRLEEALRDGDHIWAVIKGSAINNDGSTKHGMTAPSLEGQREVVQMALRNAGVPGRTIGYVEAHGTGTGKGDPTEFQALSEAYQTSKDERHWCSLGSVKSNVGHLQAAAGVAGLIKVALCLQHKKLAPTLHFQTPNPAIDLAGGPFRIQTQVEEWPEGPVLRRAGVHSLGFGGTNAHAILEEAPAAVPENEDTGSGPQLLILSARTDSALRAAAGNFAREFRQKAHLHLADAAFTLQVGRRAFAHRLALVSNSTGDAADALEAPHSNVVYRGVIPSGSNHPPVVWMFPGQGPQHVHMLRGLYESEPVVRAEMDRCAEILRRHIDLDLLAIVHPEPGRETACEALIGEPLVAQLSLLVAAHALSRLWLSWGLRPACLIGYSVGEIAAATVAEVFTIEQALELVVHRARLAERTPRGAMLAVALSNTDVQPYLSPGLSVAADASPDQCVVAGMPEAIAELRERLREHRIATRTLDAVTRAYHTAWLDPVLEDYEKVVRRLELRRPTIPMVSSVTGGWLNPDEATDPMYWVRELRDTVRFSEGMALLTADDRRVFLEVGPGMSLTSLARTHLRGSGRLVVSSCPPDKGIAAEAPHLLATLGRLWVAGCEFHWHAVHQGRNRRRVPLPTYPFERKRCWLDASPAPAQPSPPAQPVSRPPMALIEWDAASEVPYGEDAAVCSIPPHRGSHSPSIFLNDRFHTPLERDIAALWLEVIGGNEVHPRDHFFEVGGNSLMAVQLISRVREYAGRDIPLHAFLKTPTLSHLCALAREDTGVSSDEELSRLLDEIESLPAACVANGTEACMPPDMVGTSSSAADQASPPMEYSLMFFSADANAGAGKTYELVLEGARFADRHGFSAVWTPERHFHPFGGLYPNPSVLGAAIASVTKRIHVRAGSVVLPLHHPARVVEEWSVIDHLTGGGRVGLGLAAGFHPHDFLLKPEAWTTRRTNFAESVQRFRQLWRGEPLSGSTGSGQTASVQVYPRPLTPDIPLWTATALNEASFAEAGRLGTNVLTALILLNVDQLAERIRLYRETRALHGHDPASGKVTVMLHTYLGEDLEEARETVRAPFCQYLRLNIAGVRLAMKEFGVSHAAAMTTADEEALVQFAFERYFQESSLCGTLVTASAMVQRLAAIGVNEIACLVDFGVPHSTALEGLERVAALCATQAASPAVSAAAASRV